MEDAVEAMGAEHRVQIVPVGKIDALEVERAPMPLRQSLKARVFQSRVIIIVEDVDTEHPIATGQERIRRMHSDESGYARDKCRCHPVEPRTNTPIFIY
jgi:hypothetical protein